MAFTINRNNEQRILSYYMHNPEEWVKLSDKFCDVRSKKIAEALNKMFMTGIKEFNIDTLINQLCNMGYVIDRPDIEIIYNTFIDFKDIDKAIEILNADFIKNDLDTNVMAEIFQNINLNREEGLEKLKSLLDSVNEKISELDHSEKMFLNGTELKDAYLESIERRAKEPKKTTGDLGLDSMLMTPFAKGEQTTIFGQKGSGKSTYVRQIMLNLITKTKTPVIYFTLEMSRDTTMDTLCCNLCNIPLDVYMNDPEYKKDERLRALGKLERSNLWICEDPVVRISDIESRIMQVQKIMNTKYLVVFIDLATMLQEFSNTKNAKEMDKPVNRLNEIAKRHGVHIVNVIQENENRFRNGKINKVKSMKFFKPTMADIKDAAVIAERSRVVLYIWNETYMRNSFFAKDDEDETENEDPRKFIEIKVIKQNIGKQGAFCKYLYEPEFFKMTYFKETHEEEGNG